MRSVETCHVAAIQMTSGPVVDENLQVAARLLEEAARRRAVVAVLPENFSLMAVNDEDRLAVAEDDHGPVQSFLAAQAQRLSMWVVAGSVPMTAPTEHKVRSVCLVIDPSGHTVARYHKVHLFDVRLDNGEEYRESAYIDPGECAPVVVDTPAGRLGLTICYDVRFPEMYRRLVDLGAEWFVVPSAFTATTGRAHWEVLLRARAIENLAYVVAPAQVGLHANGRRTYGDTMIVSPWGEVLSRLARVPGVVTADLDRIRVAHTRKTFPTIYHRRFEVR